MTDAFAHLSSGFPPHGEGNGGDEGNRTLDPLLAGQVLSPAELHPHQDVRFCLFNELHRLRGA